MARTAKTNFMGAELPPFMDFSKIAGEFKMPQFDTAALIEYQRRNLEAFTAANQLAFEGAKAITERQVELARQVWEESAEAARTLGTVGKPEDQRSGRGSQSPLRRGSRRGDRRDGSDRQGELKTRRRLSAWRRSETEGRPARGGLFAGRLSGPCLAPGAKTVQIFSPC